jgi:hypothetical protein
VVAQDLLSSDLSTLKVDSLSDADIAKIKTQLQANNSTVKQMEWLCPKGCLYPGLQN